MTEALKCAKCGGCAAYGSGLPGTFSSGGCAVSTAERSDEVSAVCGAFPETLPFLPGHDGGGIGDLRGAPLAHSHSDIEEAMSKPNGKDNEHGTHITANGNGHTRTEVFREISQIKMTSIVCTPARLVDLLEHIDGMFTLRETTFTFGGRGTHVAVAAIPLQEFHEAESSIELGECCVCRGTEDVFNIVMHDKRAPIPGTGWGCVVCGLPSDGAVSVVCNRCRDAQAAITEVCYGFPLEKKRVALTSLDPTPFEHDMTKHADEFDVQVIDLEQT